jgi:ATP-binding cassette, subfamily B, bacterial HlyB/CyaB
MLASGSDWPLHNAQVFREQEVTPPSAAEVAAAQAPLQEVPPTGRASAVRCLMAVLQHHGLSASGQKLAAALADPCEAATLARAAEEAGLKARHVQLAWEELAALADVFPAVARLKNGNFVVVAGMKRADGGAVEAVAVMDPLAKLASAIFLVPQAAFRDSWGGELVLAKREYPLLDENQPFGLRWFLPEIVRQKGLLRDVAVAALTLHLLALAVPIFIQLVIDKVVVHRGYSTLYVLTGGVMLALAFDAVFSFLRQYILLYTSNRIDIRLAQKTFAHLVRLPITYFDTGTAGVITRHMQQVEKIRQFLTGRLFTTMLDASVLVVFLPSCSFTRSSLRSSCWCSPC